MRASDLRAATICVAQCPQGDGSSARKGRSAETNNRQMWRILGRVTRGHMADSTIANEWLETTPGERFKVQTSSAETDGAYLILEVRADPRIGVPLHVHDREEEHFIVVEGTLQLAVDGWTQDFPAGTSVTVRKGMAHAWCNLTESPVHFIAVFTPGHIEGLFRAVAAKTVDNVEEFARSYGTRIVGPALRPSLNNYFAPRQEGS